MEYKNKIIKGISWITFLRLVIRCFGYIRIAFLARIFTPYQFGIFGIITLLLTFIETLSETGINVVLIQVKEKIEDYINTAWVLSIVRGLILVFILFGFRNFISNYFDINDSSSLILIISFTPLIRGFINPCIIKLQKDLLFKKEFVIRTTLYLSEIIVVITLSVITRSINSLAWGLLFSSFGELILSFLLFDIRPKIKFDKTKIKNFLNMGKWVTGYRIFDYLYQNIDDLFISKFININSLGIYQMAYKISTLPISEITEVFVKVTLPVFIKISPDKKRLKRAFLITLTYTSILILIFGIIIFLFSYEIVYLLLGINWLSTINIIKILVVFGVMKGITGIMQSFFLSINKQRYVTYVTIVTLLGLVLTIIPLVRLYGIYGVGLSVVVGSTLGLILSSYYMYLIIYE